MNNSQLLQNREQVFSLLSSAESIGIILSDEQNLDNTAGSLALYLSLEAAGRKVQIVSKKDPLVEVSNLVGIDRIRKNFEGSTKTLILSIPYKEGEVEKVSFTTEAGRMNFNIVGGEQGITPFSQDDVQIFKQGSAPTVVFAVGMTRPEELSGLVDLQTVKTIAIDIRQPSFGDVSYGDSSFSSISEIVFRIIEDLALPLDVDISQNLLDGIVSGTENFTSPHTSSYAFEAAGILLRQGAVRKLEGAHQMRQSDVRREPSFSQPQSIFTPQPQKSREAVPNNTRVINEELSQDDDVPSDWFVPKVFKGSKKQD